MAKDTYRKTETCKKPTTTEPKAVPVVATEPKPEAKADVASATRLDPAKGKLYKDSAGRFFVVVDTAEPEPKPEPKPASKPESKPEPKPETKPDPKAEPEPKPAPAPKAETKPKASKPKAEPKPEPKAEPKPEPKAEPKPEAVPVPVVVASSFPINGPGQAYRYLDREDGQWYISTDLFVAKQAGVYWMPIWAWFVDGAYHHTMSGAECRKCGLHSI